MLLYAEKSGEQERSEKLLVNAGHEFLTPVVTPIYFQGH